MLAVVAATLKDGILGVKGNMTATDTRQTVHHAIASALVANGVDTMFGLMGDANMFMVDWKKPAKEVQAALLASPEKVQIGRSWPIWPTVGRVTVGSASDMAAFRSAVAKVMSV